MNVRDKIECLSLESLARANTSLLQAFVNSGQKSFITLTPGPDVIKLFTSIF